jgi:predicted RNA binding protein YcfA (HicA-like mRNA interferase family)
MGSAFRPNEAVRQWRLKSRPDEQIASRPVRPSGQTGSERAGFYLKRQKGSHMVLRRDEPFAQVVVPAHPSIDTGTLAAILDAAGIDTEQFRELL